MQSQQSSSVSAIFFNEANGQSGEVFWLPSSGDSWEVLNVKIMYDIDPSLNFTLARGLYARVYGCDINSIDEYVQILNCPSLKFHELLQLVNSCDTLIDNTADQAEEVRKIYFIKVNEETAKRLGLFRIDLKEGGDSQLTEKSRSFMKEFNIQEYFLNNAFCEKQLFCILNSEDQATWKHLYEGLFQGHLQTSNQKWITKSLVEQEKIDDDLYNQIKGFVVTGSHYDAYDTSLPWVPRTYELLNKIIYPTINDSKKLLGVCWGHQAVGHGCGGKTSRMPHGNMFMFRDEIVFTESSKVGALMPQQFYSLKCHGDYVFELAKEAKLIASSSRVEIEGMEINDRALTFQFHPEFNMTIIMKIIQMMEELSTEEKEAAQAVVRESYKPDGKLSNDALTGYLKNFLTK